MKKKKGVTIEFLSKGILNGKSFEEKLDMIMKKVKSNSIIVLEEALTPEEKKTLIRKSVEEIDDSFPGVEFSGFNSKSNLWDRILKKLTGKEKREGLVIVGSSKVMEKLDEEKDSISLIAKIE